MFGAVLAVGGALYASYMGYIDPSSFTVTESMAILAIVVFGGLGNAFGAIMGTVFMTLLPEMVRSVGIDGVAAANLRQILVGVCLILALMFRPEGLFRERIIGGVGRK
jgi:branched-chain amino acid transport system permease protein